MYDKSRRRRRTLAGWNLLVCFSHFEADVADLSHPSTGFDAFDRCVYGLWSVAIAMRAGRPG